MSDPMAWVEAQEQKIKEERSKDYFNIEEGANRFVLLSHCAPLAQVFEGGKYRAAVEGDKNVSIKGVCWVYQNGQVKQAKLPYVVLKAIRGIQQDPEWDFKFPFPHVLTLNAKGAGEKTVEYTLQPSPKKVEIPQDILDELAKKPTPEDIVEKIKGNSTSTLSVNALPGYPDSEVDPADIPF